MYYAQAWHLAYFKERLFEGEFQAWVHGPVLADLYHYYKEHRWQPIVASDLGKAEISKLENELLTTEQNELLADIMSEYFSATAYELERMTHMESPWLQAREGLASDVISNAVIKDEWMTDYYGKYVNHE
jgi:uncharacterized phage-associated protein